MGGRVVLRLSAVVAVAAVCVLILSSGGSSLFFYNMNSTGFNAGTFLDTIFNSSIVAVNLNFTNSTNMTYKYTGNFTSQVFDGGSSLEWTNISWTPGAPYGMPFPGSNFDELGAGIIGGANMSGNILLFHLDEAAGSSTFTDSSGTANIGSCIFCPKRNDSGILGSVFAFNVTNNSIMVASSSSMNVNSTTIEAWIMSNNVTFNSISSSSYHACATATDGFVYCWGYNADGELGDGSITDRYLPTKVMNVANATSVSAGASHTCARTTNGTVWCWGTGSFGQIGDGGSSQRLTPVIATRSYQLNFTKISAGSLTTCGVTVNGTVYCWGRDNNGQLGQGTTSGLSVPNTTFGSGDLNFTDISEGVYFTCGITLNGTVYCWGNNANGQLGNGTASGTIKGPNITIGSGSLNFTNGSISAGYGQACAVAYNGTAYCWGTDTYGQLGNGSTSGIYPFPVTVIGGYNFTKIRVPASAADEHACGITVDRSMYCWGAGSYGQLGDKTLTSSIGTPRLVSIAGGVVDICTSMYSTLALTNKSQVLSWGDNIYGQLGTGTTSMVLTPRAVWGINASAVYGNSNFCSLLSNGSVYCWGTNGYGQLGDGTSDLYGSADKYYPNQVSGITNAISISHSQGHGGSPPAESACVVLSTGGIKCWGRNNANQLGDGTTTDKASPVDAVGLSGMISVSVGGSHACGIKNDGSIYCWGSNGNGQIGDGTTTTAMLPKIIMAGVNFTNVSAASSPHTCGIAANGTVYCWGINTNGCLGDGSTTQRTSPVAVSGSWSINFTNRSVTTGLVSSAATPHTCAISLNGTAYCWGSGANGRLGNGGTTSSSTPVAVTGSTDGGFNFTYISAGDGYTCGIVKNGTIYCWGINTNGQLGDGTVTQSTTPVNVSGSGSLNFTNGTVSAGFTSTCATSMNGTVYCWGTGRYGGLGSGTGIIYAKSLPVLTNVVGRNSNSYGIYLDTSQAIHGYVSNSNVSGRISTDGNWTHVAMTYGSGVQTLYVNGAQVSSSNVGQANHYGDNITIGSYGILLDEVAVFNRSLSASEIYSHFMRGAVRLNVTVRSCNSSDCSGGATWNSTYNSSNATSVLNLSVDTNRYFQFRAFFSTINSLVSPVLYNVTIGYRIIDYGKPDIGLYMPVNNYNTSNTSMRVNFTASDNMTLNLMNCSLYVNGAINGTGRINSTVVNNTAGTLNALTSFDVHGLTTGNYSWNVTCADEAGNTNTSQTRNFYVDRSPPSAVIVNLYPNSTNSVDPNTFLNVSGNITDDRMGVDTVTLQYKSSADSDWTNKSTFLESDGWYKSNFTTHATTGYTYSYRFCYNDTLGNFNCSSTSTIDSSYDYTWTVSSTDMGTILGFIGLEKNIGTLWINNTGDNNILFTITSNYPLSMTFNNTETSKSFTLSSGTNATINISANFSSTTGTTTAVTINTSASTGTSSPASPTFNTTSVTLTSYTGGPYMQATITNYSINLTQGTSATLNSTVKNIGNETANNTWINWTLPTGLTNASGNLEFFTENITASSGNHSNITINANASTISAGTATIYLKANCTNCSEASTSVTINILCNSAYNDTICGLGCSYSSNATNYDTDCTAPAGTTTIVTNTVTTTTTGGAVLGGGALTDAQKKALFQATSEEFEFVRGTDDSFIITITNPLDADITDANITISGYISSKLRLEAGSIALIPKGGSRNITVFIDAPKYLSSGKNDIKFTINGKTRVKGIRTDFTEERSVTLLIQDIPREKAMEYVNSSYSVREKFGELGYPSGSLEELIAQLEYELNGAKSYSGVQTVGEKITKLLEDAVSSNSTISKNSGMIAQSEHDGISTPNSIRLNNLAAAAFSRGEFALALSRAQEASQAYALETKGEFNLGMFVYNNFPQVSAGSLLALGAITLVFFRIKLGLVNRRLRALAKEENVVLGLIKQVQKECFEQAKMSMEEYMEAVAQYEGKLGKAIQTRIELESMKSYLTPSKWWNRSQAMYHERSKLLELMKQTQSDYLEKGRIETHVYENRMKSLRTRLSEVEEKISMAEAKKAIRSRRAGPVYRRRN